MTTSTSTVSNWLRWLGAALLVLATATYLVQGWTDIGVLGRELSWAALTGSLTLFGIFAIRKLDDPKGARVGLALAAASIPAHFAEVGGGIWSTVHEGKGSLGAALGAALVLVLLAPVLALGVGALVRRKSAALTACLYLLSAALLVPTRNGDVVAVLVVCELVLIALLERFSWSREVLLSTREGVSARCLLLVPVALLLLRNVNYPSTDAWFAMLLFFPASVALAVSHAARFSAPWSRGLEIPGVFGMAAATFLAFPLTVYSGLVVSAAVSLYALIAHRGGVFQWCGLAAFALSVLPGFAAPEVTLTLALVPAALVQAGVGFQRRSLLGVIAAALLGLSGVVAHLSPHVPWRGENAWMVAAGAGVLLLLLASLIESRRAELERFWSHWGRHFGEPG